MMVNQILESQIIQKSWEQGNRAVNIIQLFNGSAGNRSNNFIDSGII
jgi:glutamate synthase domain-containing protein 3